MTRVAPREQNIISSNFRAMTESVFDTLKNQSPKQQMLIAGRTAREGEKSIEQIRAQNAQAQGKVQTCDSNTPNEKMSIEKIGTTFEQDIEKLGVKNVISLINYLAVEKDPSKEQRDKLQDGLVKFIKSIDKIRANLKNGKKCDAISEIKKFYAQVDVLRSDAEKIGKDLGVCLGTREECVPKQKTTTYPSQSI